MEKGGIVELTSGYDEPYLIGKALMEGGKKAAVLTDKLDMPFSVRLFHGMQDKSVTLKTAIGFASHITSPDLRLTLVKDADHGFSRPQDMDLITFEIKNLTNRGADDD